MKITFTVRNKRISNTMNSHTGTWAISLIVARKKTRIDTGKQQENYRKIKRNNMESLLGQFYNRIKGSQEDIASESLTYILKKSASARQAINQIVELNAG